MNHNLYLGALEFPGDAGHDVDGVCTSDTNAAASESSSVGRVRVGPDQHDAGESVIFKHNLVNNSRSRLPEPDSVFLTSGSKEVVDLSNDNISALFTVL